jgi:hypothetical protein
VESQPKRLTSKLILYTWIVLWMVVMVTGDERTQTKEFRYKLISLFYSEAEVSLFYLETVLRVNHPSSSTCFTWCAGSMLRMKERRSSLLSARDFHSHMVAEEVILVSTASAK